MELSELQQAWHGLDRRLSDVAFQLRPLNREPMLDRIRTSLRPLFWGQVLQIVAGIGLALLAVSFWTGHLATPHYVLIGIVFHLYAVAMIVAGGLVIEAIRRLDFDAPVLTIQKRLARLERVHVLAGWCVGLPWWVLWLPALMMVLAQLGADVHERIPHDWVLGNIVVGLIGIVATLAVVRWLKRSGGLERAERVEAVLAGPSIGNAREFLAELKAFEAE